MLSTNGIPLFKKSKLDFSWMKLFTRKGLLSFLESFVRNLAFIMVNVVGEQGTFWIANSFIWGWLLLPVIQLRELIKSDCSENKEQTVIKRSKGYFFFSTIIVASWLVTIPIWKIFLRDTLKLENYEKVYKIALFSLFFYILFAYNNIIDSFFMD